MNEYKIVVDNELSNLPLTFTPSSVFLNGTRTLAYVIENNTIFFNNNVPVGTTIILVPSDVINILDEEITTVIIPDVGKRSVYSTPFGRAVFSLDGITWTRSLTHIFPATIYVKYVSRGVIKDCLCYVDIEVVVWSGGDEAYVDEYNKVIISGGLEYEFI